MSARVERTSELTISAIRRQGGTGEPLLLPTAPHGLPGGLSTRMRGAMLWFNPAKKHGFVRTEDGERLLVQCDGFAPGHELGDRCAGTVVEFDRQAADVEGGYTAVAVTVVDDTSGRRARSHRSAMKIQPRR